MSAFDPETEEWLRLANSGAVTLSQRVPRTPDKARFDDSTAQWLRSYILADTPQQAAVKAQNALTFPRGAECAREQTGAPAVHVPDAASGRAGEAQCRRCGRLFKPKIRYGVPHRFCSDDCVRKHYRCKHVRLDFEEGEREALIDQAIAEGRILKIPAGAAMSADTLPSLGDRLFTRSGSSARDCGDSE